MSKTTRKGTSKNKKDAPEKLESTMFTNLSFSLFECGVDLAPKRAKIFLDIVKSNGGKGIPLNEGKRSLFFILVEEKNLPDYVLTSKQITLQV